MAKKENPTGGKMSDIRGYRCAGILESEYGPRTCNKAIRIPGLCVHCAERLMDYFNHEEAAVSIRMISGDVWTPAKLLDMIMENK